MEIFQPIWTNFLKFDFIIIILAIITSFIYYLCMQSAKKLESKLKPKGSLVLGDQSRDSIVRHFDYYLNGIGEEDLLESRKRMNALYVYFLNITAIFPLMGLLGTVLSLIPMVDSLETELFFLALTSTFWGLVFSIIFKLLNGFLQAKVEENIEMVNTYLVRRDSILAQQVLEGQSHE